ncbi:MAG: DUF167 domain-containing protein [Rhodospirillaceae bacterium]|nr:DUF167 domain-containing protein [Rhodospirillaceae bacterium]
MSFYRVAPGGLTLSVRVTPKASKAAINGTMAMPDGEVLKVSVMAPPDKGKANQAVCDLIAAKLGLPKSAVTVISGHTDRRKVVQVSLDQKAVDTNALIAVVGEWTKA